MPTASNAQRTAYRKPIQATLALHDAIQTVLANRTAPMGVRQIFYQLETMGVVPKTESGVEKVSRAVQWLRENGEVPWNQIVDNGSKVRGGDTATKDYDPKEELAAGVEEYRGGIRTSLWAGQPRQVQVWLEKDGLIGTVEAVTKGYRVPLLSGGGSASLTILRDGFDLLEAEPGAYQPATIFMLFDHDPSGYFMPWTIEDKYSRWNEEAGGILSMKFVRLGLVASQIGLWSLQAAERKTKWSTNLKTARSQQATAEARGWPRGSNSVELDAVPQATLQALIRESIEGELDVPAWQASRAHQALRAVETEELVDSVLEFLEVEPD